jgi:hypothetical protein
MMYRRIVVTVSWLAVLVLGPERVFAVDAGVLPDNNNANLATCPETQPLSGQVCTIPIPAAGSLCEYGEICCPGEGGDCVARTVCICYTNEDKLIWSCSVDRNYGILPCPSSCPEFPPTESEWCEIDQVFSMHIWEGSCL